MTVPDENRPSRLQLREIANVSAADGELDAQSYVQRLSYRGFIAIVSFNALAVLIAYYLIPLPRPADEVLVILDTINAVILLGDFLIRLRVSHNRKRYFFIEWGWLDFLGSLPFSPLLRLFRILRSLGLWLRLARTAGSEVRLEARRRLAESALLMVAALVLLVVTFGALAIAIIEPPAPNATIQSGSDALWYVIVSIATVGYGDEIPVTNAGRFVGAIVILVGVGAFSVLTSFIASRFLARAKGDG
jgi:voltage-gated potassium channel